MKAQAQARRNARNSTLPSSRTNLYSQSISLSSTKFFQKFDQIMFASPKREKSHEVAPVSKEIPEKPKAFQKEIEDRFEQVSARKSYNFPRSPQKEQNTEIQQTSSSDSSTNSLKQTTVYNLYAQNPGSQNPFSPKLPSVLMGEPFKQRSPNREALKGKVRINISEEDMSINVNKDEGNIDDSSKKLSGNNTPSSYRKLVSLIEVQLNKLPEQKSVDTPKDSLQQNLTKTWLGMISTSSRHTNQDFCTSGSGFLLSPSVGAGSIEERKSVKAPVEEPQGHTLGEKPQQRDIDKIGKSSYYLRASSRARQAGDVSDSKGFRDGKSNDKSNSRDGEPKSFMKVLGVRNLNCSSTTLSSWDFSLIKAANAKRSVSPKTNMAVVNANKISLKSSNKDEGSYKAEPIKILDEEDQERLFREYAKGANTQMRKRSRENNLSLVPEDVGKMNLNEMRKRKNVNSVSHLPGSDFSKVLKAGLISPPRDGNRDNVSRQEVSRSVVKKTEKKRMNSNGIENRVPAKMEKSQGNISGEHRKGQKSTEKRDSSNKGQRNANSPHRIGKFRGNETPLMMPFGRTQQYSLFKEESEGRDGKQGTCTTVSKNTLLRNLFLNRVRK